MRTLGTLALLSVMSVGCGDSGTSSPNATPASADATSTVLKKNLRLRPPLLKGVHSATSATPMKVDKPVGGDVVAASYPEAGIPAIDAGCKEPWTAVEVPADQAPGVVLATVGQIFLANPTFKLVDAKPARASEAQITVWLPGGSGAAPAASAAPSAKPVASSAPSTTASGKSWVVARCHDAGTCTRIAAMLKAVAKWTPTTGCGEPAVKPTGTATTLPAPALPADPVAACARLGACKLASEPASTDDPIGACQKSASSFKTDCASKPTCADVLACQK